MSELPSDEEIVAQYWPLHGPYSPDHAAAAASTLAELVRYLNYATGQGAARALPYASHVYTVLGGLKVVADRLGHTLRQLTTRTAALRDDPTLGHCQHRDDPQAATTEAAAAWLSLDTARHTAAALSDALNAAQSHLAWLEHHEQGEAES